MENTSNLGLVYRPRVRNMLLKSLEPTAKQIAETSDHLNDHSSTEYMYIGIITYSIVLRNQLITQSVLNTAKLVMTSKTIYRQFTKKYVNESVKLANAYEAMTKGIMHYDPELMNMLKEMGKQYQQKIHNHMMIFFYCLKQEMDSARVEDTVIRANVEYCSVLLELAKQAQDCLEETNLLLAANIKHLGYLRLTALRYAWEKVRKEINGKYISKDVNLNTPKCTQACRNLQKAMVDFDMIADLMIK